MDVWMDGCMDGRMNGCMDGRMNGWMDGSVTRKMGEWRKIQLYENTDDILHLEC